MLNDIQNQINALGPRFALPFEALGAIRDQHGDARMFEHALAHPAEDETVRLVALAFADGALALKLMTDLLHARRSGKTEKVARVRRRLDRVLAAAKARAQATCDA